MNLNFITNFWPKWDDQRATKGGVIDTRTGEVYWSIVKDNNRSLRVKLIQITLVSLPLGLLLSYAGIISVPVGLLLSWKGVSKVAFRLFGIFAGNFIENSHRVTKADWLARRHTLCTQGREKELTHKNYIRQVYVRALFIELPKELIKIATVPLQMIAISCSAIYGACVPTYQAPLNGGWLVSKISLWTSSGRVLSNSTYISVETRWYTPITLKEKIHKFFIDFYNEFIFDSYFVYSEFFPCMQPKNIWDERNLYARTPSGAQYQGCCGSRTTLLTIEQRLKTHAVFWNSCLGKDKLDHLVRVVQTFRKASSSYEHDEIQLKRVCYLMTCPHTEKEKEEYESKLALRDQCHSLLNSIEDIEDYVAGFSTASSNHFSYDPESMKKLMDSLDQRKVQLSQNFQLLL